MTLPLTTTTVLVEAPSGAAEPFEADTFTARGTFPAHISSPSGRDRQGDAGGQRIDAVLLTEGTVARNDRVTDQATGAVFRVSWVLARAGLGLDHTRAGLVDTAGEVAA